MEATEYGYEVIYTGGMLVRYTDKATAIECARSCQGLAVYALEDGIPGVRINFCAENN